MKKSLILKNVVGIMLIVVFMTAPMVVFGQWSVGDSNAQSGGTPNGSIYQIIKSTMNYLLAILGFIGDYWICYSWYYVSQAAGDEKRIGSAKNALTMSIMGVIVALLYVIVGAVESWLNASSNSDI